MKAIILFCIAINVIPFSCIIFSSDSDLELKLLNAIANTDYKAIQDILLKHAKKDNFLNRTIYIHENHDLKYKSVALWYSILHNARISNTNIASKSHSFTPLSFAIAMGDKKMAEFLYKKRRATTQSSNLWDAVCAAVDYNASMIPLLYTWNVPLDSSIIVRVVESDNVTALKELMKHGAQLNIKINTKKSSLLHLACSKKNCLTMAQFLLDNGVYIDEPDADGCTPLHESAGAHFEKDAHRFFVNYGANSKSVDFLLDRGANVKAITKDGRSAIECLSHKNDTDAKKLLCSGAPYPTRDQYKAMIERLSSTSSIPHYFYPEVHLADTLTVLNRATGNDLNKKSNMLYGLTPLHWAVIRGNKEIVDVLLTYKKSPKKLKKIMSFMPVLSHFVKEPIKKIDLNCKDNNGRTPLMWAARLDHDYMYQTLRKHGANRMLPDNKGNIALNYAANYRSRKVFEQMMVNERPNPLEIILEDQTESKK